VKSYEGGSFVQHEQCIANEIEGKQPCSSSDAMAIYEKQDKEGKLVYDASCWSCRQGFSPSQFASSSVGKAFLGEGEAEGVVRRSTVKPKDRITREEFESIKSKTDQVANGYLGLPDEVFKFYGHRLEKDDEGNVVKEYYPETQGGKFFGMKYRFLLRDGSKCFGRVGWTGQASDLSGQSKFKEGGKYCVPMDTKALTRRGWLGYEDILVGDEVLGYDQETHTKVWTKVSEKHLFRDEVFEFGKGNLKLRSTKDHRWFVSQRSTESDHKVKTRKREVRTLSQFTSETGLITNAPFNNYQDKEPIIGMAEGKYDTDWVGRVLNMSQAQRQAYLEGFLVADGYHNGSYRLGSQNDGPLFESLLLASYLVHDKVVRVKGSLPNNKGNVCKNVIMSNSQHRTRITETISSVGVQDVWCLTTETGSWVMRQGDCITITGNCLVVGGERDKCAAYHMLKQYQIQKNQDMFNAIPVVSPTTGETSAYKQLQAQYDWLDSFENIILGFDSDDAGQEAMEAALKVLPIEKVKIARWSENDPFDMWEKGKSAQFLRDFYDAKDVVKSKVKTSKVADDEIEVELGRKKIPLPPFMKPLQDLMAGGIPLGYLINLGAATGIGKTTIINEILYYWIFNSPYKIGILSLELNAGQYQTMMLSRHIGKKLTLIEDPEEAVAFVQRPEIIEKRIELREDEFGEERYTILDDRDGDLESVAHQINKLITKHDCKLIVIDPLNDLFEGSTIESQTAFVKYLKTIIKEGVSVFNVCHITKGRTQLDNKGNRILRQLTEDDFAGVSNIAKSGGCNILAVRDKYAEDDLEKNTTYIEVPKCRWTGRSGSGGEWVYDNKTHTMVDKAQFLADNPSTPSQGSKVSGAEKDVFDE